MVRIMDYTVEDDDDGEIDLLHPNGRCTCFGEGKCEWCVRTAEKERQEEGE